LIYSDDAQLFSERETYHSTKASVVSTKETGVPPNSRRTMAHIFKSRNQNGGQNYDENIANKFFENCGKRSNILKGQQRIKQRNIIRDEIKSWLNSSNPC
jgi:hypothetical protein